MSLSCDDLSRPVGACIFTVAPNLESSHPMRPFLPRTVLYKLVRQMNKLRHIITKTQDFSPENLQWSSSDDFYAVDNNSLSADLLVFASHHCEDFVNCRSITFHIFCESSNNKCSFVPVNGESCRKELIKLMKEVIPQVEENSIQRHHCGHIVAENPNVSLYTLD